MGIHRLVPNLKRTFTGNLESYFCLDNSGVVSEPGYVRPSPIKLSHENVGPTLLNSETGLFLDEYLSPKLRESGLGDKLKMFGMINIDTFIQNTETCQKRGYREATYTLRPIFGEISLPMFYLPFKADPPTQATVQDWVTFKDNFLVKLIHDPKSEYHIGFMRK